MASQKDQIKMYRDIYRQNRDDVGGYIQQSQPQPQQLDPEMQRWAQFFDDLNAGIDPYQREARAALPKELTALNPLEGSSLLQPPRQPSKLEKLGNSIVSPARPKETQADINRRRRAEIQPRNGFEAAVKSVADPVANFIDSLLYENVAGQFVTRAGHSAAGMVGPTVTPKPETGSKIADVVADIGGGIAGFGLNAATGGAPGTNLLSGPYRAADAALLSPGGQKLTQAAANQIGKVFKPETAQKLAETGLRGAAAGAIQNVAQSGMRGETDAQDIALAAGLGAGLGALGDVAAYGIGQGIKTLMKKNGIPEKEIAEILALPPSGKETRMAAAAERSRLPVGEEPIISPPQTKAIAENVSAGRPELQQIDNAMNDLQMKHEQAIIDEYKALKESVAQLGESRPTNKELYEVARERVGRTGFDEPPRPNDNIPEFLRLDASLEEMQQPMGISAFGKAGTPYERASLEDTMSQIRSRSQKELDVRTKKDTFYQNFVDDVHSFNRFDKFAEKVLNRQLKASERVHTSALNARGADMIAAQIVKEGLVNKEGQVVGRSLKERLAGLPLNRYAEFEDYLLNRHAMTRAERGEKVFGEKVNWNPELAAGKIAQYEEKYPMFHEIAEDLYDYQRTMVNEWLVKTGMISQEQANAWFEANPYYVPNKRHFSNIEKGGAGYRSKKGYANQSVPVKKFNKKGSTRQIISPIESIIENTDAFVKAAKRNEVMQKFVQRLNQDPEAYQDWAEIVQSFSDVRDLKKMLDDGIGSLLDDVAKDYDKAFKQINLDTDDIVRVLVDGEPVHVQIKDKDLLRSAMALGPERSAWLLDQVGKLTNMFKTFTTGVNPYFVARNITRDLGDSWVFSKSTGNPLTFVNDFLKAAIDIFGNKQAWKEYKNIGGGHTSQVASRNMLMRSKMDVLPKTYYSRLRTGPRWLWSKLEDALSATESMSRLAEFKRLRGSSTPEELQKALYEAQEVAVNFKRRGALTKEIDKVFPYFNAAVQGLDRFVRSFKDDPVKALVKATLAMTVPTAVLYAMNRDNPRYQELPENTKDNFFLIPIDGGEKFIRIAKPREFGVLFSGLPERLMRQFADEDPDAWDEFASLLVKTFSLPGLEGGLTAKGGLPQKALGTLRDTIGGPFVDLAMNQNFAGSPIVPGYLERLSPELQYDEKTSSLARKAAELMGGSPKQYDYIMQQYLGGIGKAILPGAAPAGNPLKELSAQFVTDPTYSNKLSTRFYDVKDKLDQAYADRGVKGELPEWYSDGARKRLNKLSESMSNTRKVMKAIEADRNLSQQQKEEQLRELREEINELARVGIELTKDLKIPKS
ncbi:hypothetical protein PsJ27TS7_45850 [Paenibacillus dendritiformis]|uniref:LPD38 domain-containing protein n=3 Tax=Paenibacillus dendritiformis TaxID=130049 RepID=UPI001F45FF3E|nr:LPD38 domain-containing protein [Paenibacillus dendritiformis]